MLLSASLLESFWDKAALIAMYTTNHLPSSVLDNCTMYKLLYDMSLDYSILWTFGCACFLLLSPHEYNKLQPISHLCCFVGYGIERKGYRCYDPIAQRLQVSWYVIFWEHKIFFILSRVDLRPSESTSLFKNTSLDVFPISLSNARSSNSSGDLGSPIDVVAQDDPGIIPIKSCQFTWIREPLKHLCDFHCHHALATIHEPTSFKKASSHLE